MGVTRYRSVEDMPPPSRNPGASLASRIRQVWARARRLAPPSYPPGVQKFQSIEAAQQARHRDQQERIRLIRLHRDP
jgi:hypothetical protein